MSSFNLLMNGNASVLFFTLLKIQVSYFSPFLFNIVRTGKRFYCDPLVNATEDVKSYPCHLVTPVLSTAAQLCRHSSSFCLLFFICVCHLVV